MDFQSPNRARSSGKGDLVNTCYQIPEIEGDGTHAKKSGRHYRYYTSQAVIRKSRQTDEPGRIPAHDLEVAVIDCVLEFLKSPRELLRLMTPAGREAVNGKYSELLKRASEKAANWNKLSTEKRERFITGVLERVVVHPDGAEILIRKNILIQKLFGKEPAQSTAGKNALSAMRIPPRTPREGRTSDYWGCQRPVRDQSSRRPKGGRAGAHLPAAANFW
jgi:hypothetical protein